LGPIADPAALSIVWRAALGILVASTSIEASISLSFSREHDRLKGGASVLSLVPSAAMSGLRTRQRGDAQGYYALSAAGDFYGGLNSHNIDKVIELLDGARRRLAADPPQPVSLTETELGPEARVPADAAVLRVFSRIDPLPAETPAKSLNRSVGRDHLWVLKRELDEKERRHHATRRIYPGPGLRPGPVHPRGWLRRPDPTEAEYQGS
jgi:hypothetical protein